MAWAFQRGALKNAAWISKDRADRFARIALALYALLIVYLVPRFTASGTRHVSTDFIGFWTAARLAISQGFASAYDIPAQAFFQHHTFGVQTFVPFYYPPPFLFLVLPFGTLTLSLAYAAFATTGYLLSSAMLRLFFPRLTWIIAAAPAALMTFLAGQSSAIVCALTFAAFAQLNSNAFAAGLVFGALVIKPQFALLVPVALMASRQWRAIFGAAISGGALTLLSVAAIGVDGVSAYLRAARTTAAAIGDPSVLSKMQSVFAFFRLLHTPASLAWSAQIFATATAAAIVYRVWRGTGEFKGKCAVLTLCALAASPWVSGYDYLLALFCVCWMTVEISRSGAVAWERLAVALLYIAPFLSIFSSGFLHVPLGPISICIALPFVLSRAGKASSQPFQASVAAIGTP